MTILFSYCYIALFIYVNRYFAGYAVRGCIKKFKCDICSNHLLQLTRSDAPDEALIKHRQFLDISGNSSESLIFPTQPTVDVAREVLIIFEKMFLKNLPSVGIKKKILCKCKQVVFRKYSEWLMCNSECYEHRVFVINKLLGAKLYFKMKECSKELRQPGGKVGKFQQKINILEGK